MIHHYCENFTELINRTDPLPPSEYAEINLFLYLKRPADPADLNMECIIERELDKVLIRDIRGWTDYFRRPPRAPVVSSKIITNIIARLSDALAKANTTKRWANDIDRCVKYLYIQYGQHDVDPIIQREIALFTKDLNKSKILEDEMNIKGIQ